MMSENRILLLYFIILITIGTILLLLPFSWKGPERLQPIDALFTVASAACVTGLVSVDTALYTRFGQVVILLCIQFGGLGLITFSTLYLVIPSRKISLKSRRIIKEYFLDDIEYDPVTIIRQIIVITVFFELLGAVILCFGFYKTTGSNTLFYAVFNSISAFCNAGFTNFSNNLEDYYNNAIVNYTIMGLIICGGIGFVVFRDLFKCWIGKNRNFALHTKMTIFTTALLIFGGAFILYLIEYNHMFTKYTLYESITVSLFQSITPRTGGFNTVPINQMQPMSQAVITILMFIGAAPGSTGGGIKVTTFFILMLLLFRGMDEEKRITVFKRKINAGTLFKTLVFVLKALSFLAASIVLTYTAESLFKPHREIQLFPVIFECVSAFGTVGLSLGITPALSWLAKLLIIFTMLFGRVGLMILLMGIFSRKEKRIINYPEEEVLIG